jgi:hypothetical protein
VKLSFGCSPDGITLTRGPKYGAMPQIKFYSFQFADQAIEKNFNEETSITADQHPSDDGKVNELIENHRKLMIPILRIF